MTYWTAVKGRADILVTRWTEIKARHETRLTIFLEKFDGVWRDYKASVVENDRLTARKTALGADMAAGTAYNCATGATNAASGLIGGAYAAICAAEKHCRAHEYSVAHRLKKEYD